MQLQAASRLSNELWVGAMEGHRQVGWGPQTGVAVGHERTRGGPRASAGVAPRMVTRGAAGRH